ncbi:MAG TPA: ATP-binding protein [Steroidobacteraceae bacterium]|nr:ATP-binding protein [Steroidobacteraceae bacterium]
MRSIRARLLLGLLALIALTTLVAGVITYRRVLAETSSLFDYQLGQMALSLRVEAEIAPGAVPEQASDGDFYVQIWDLFGHRIYVSRPGLLIDRAYLGYRDMLLDGERWRVYSLQTGDAVIQVAQPWRVREQLARIAAVRVLVGLIPLLLLMAGAVVWIVSRGLAPLQRLAAEVERRDVHSLRPIEAPSLPREAAPLIEELNRLLARLSGAFGKQRAFVADAAHELRSPLTALSLQLQLLDRAREPGEREEARQRLGAAVDRAIHLVGQLLTLARNEPEGAPVAMQPVPLESCAREGLADVHALAQQRGIELELQAEAPVMLSGDAEALRVLVRNLADNAVRYTPSGGRVLVRVRAPAPLRGQLLVEDTGPGIPEAERERAFDRFYRRTGAVGEGSGLGLAIVKAIAERHGARVRLGQAGERGLRVSVDFP